MPLSAADENACTWLRLAFHSITCHSTPDRPCLLGERCKENKQLLTHIIIQCNGSSSCPYPGCAAVRSLLRHYNACKGNCHVCSTVATEMNGGWHAKMQGQELEAKSSDYCSASCSHCTDSSNVSSSSHAVAADCDDLRAPSDGVETPDSSATPLRTHSHTEVYGEGGSPPKGQEQVQIASGSNRGLPRQEQDKVMSATRWMVHALMAPATTDSFGHAMWAHVLGCCDGPAACASGVNCRNIKSTMFHLLQCVDQNCPLCSSICDFFSGVGRGRLSSNNNSASQAVIRPDDIESLIKGMEQSLNRLQL